MEKASILIVEDNFIVMMELKDRLLDMGYDVIDNAATGPEAIEKAERHNPDLAMMDIRLKGDMDGIDAAAQIRKRFDIPVIYLTAHTDKDTLQRAKVTEPYGYIIKPFEERELHSTIEMALYKHKIERRLKESEHWLSATLKSIGDALVATDSTGTVRMINPMAGEITGRNALECAGKHISDIFVVKNEDGSSHPDPVSQSLKNHSIVGGTNKILISASGNKIPIDYSVAPIKNESNVVNGVVLVFRDITERVKSKQLIEKQRHFLRQIIDTDPNYITVKDADGKFELTNKAIAEALGTTTEEIIGHCDSEFFPYEDIIVHRSFEKNVIESQQEIFIPEDKLVDTNGKVHLLQTFKRAIDGYKGNNKLVLSVASDITQLKITEKALRESEEKLKLKAEELSELNKKLHDSEKELIALNASKDKFFSVIAHDLRSPFTALLGLSQYLVEGIDELDKPEIFAVSEDILTCAKSTFTLLENLLQWARIKTGKIEYSPEKVNLRQAAAQVTDVLRINALKKEIEICSEVDSSLSVKADPYMVNSVLTNLVSNALKFTHKNGKVTISAEQYNGSVKITVADNGVGIKPEVIKKLFKLGENTSTKGTQKEEGAGLGLILTREFIELNKGTISVESEYGKGSKFSFTLPKNE